MKTDNCYNTKKERTKKEKIKNEVIDLTKDGIHDDVKRYLSLGPGFVKLPLEFRMRTL